ncbi:hypothetical protein Syn7502_03590 (plasmid) [Synechococcus sp. PCC 7502]|uniref:hypothetical protein n=1 Tax=Synechococcus sp. PCC 7502 TaxID=1173263 RepID=UPI00029FA716|nr:hypothetical protein [Synechococcus sp. PCC 7502]AFY75425.1 hypothetical protein Syn7502_03590 [Synechococcus sp. PCC 7502]
MRKVNGIQTLLPLERAITVERDQLPIEQLKALLETLYLDQESYGYYTNSALRQAHSLVDTNPVMALSLINGMIGLPKELYDLFDQLIKPKSTKPLKVPTFISGDSKNQNIIDRIAQLEARRNQILATGPVAEQGVWIEYGKVSKRKFRQAYYRSNKPIFQSKLQAALLSGESGLVKRQYIGEENSKQVRAAGEAIARRNELDRITREIKMLEKNYE